MTPQRWQIIGGLVGAITGASVVSFALPQTWWSFLLGLGAAVLGSAIGQFTVKNWQEAGRP